MVPTDVLVCETNWDWGRERGGGGLLSHQFVRVLLLSIYSTFEK